MWRDPYDPRGWGERLFGGLLTLLGVAIAVMVAAEIAQAVLPLLITAVLVSGVVAWLASGRGRW